MQLLDTTLYLTTIPDYPVAPSAVLMRVATHILYYHQGAINKVIIDGHEDGDPVYTPKIHLEFPSPNVFKLKTFDGVKEGTY